MMYPHAAIEYYFDHSSCHDKLLEDGLNVNNMNTGFGGAQAHVRNTKLTEGCIVLHNAMTLSVGDVQCMIFTEDDDDPFWMMPAERILNKYDRLTGETK